jgi:hypothetical protein
VDPGLPENRDRLLRSAVAVVFTAGTPLLGFLPPADSAQSLVRRDTVPALGQDWSVSLAAPRGALSVEPIV